jgi:hypothetical protein
MIKGMEDAEWNHKVNVPQKHGWAPLFQFLFLRSLSLVRPPALY